MIIIDLHMIIEQPGSEPTGIGNFLLGPLQNCAAINKLRGHFAGLQTLVSSGLCEVLSVS
jgi:hypothetical protein